MKGREFDNILDECLERLLVKGESIGQCLQSHPGEAALLEPLLETALAAKKASAIQPRAEFRARARYQFRSAVQEAASQKSRPFFVWLPRWAVAVTIVLVLILAGGGTVAAAGNSMPDGTLYPVKLATEKVRLTLTLSDIAKAKLYARLADKRVAEIIYMANKGDAQQVKAVTQRLDKHLLMLASLALVLRGDAVPEAAPRAMAPAAAPTPAPQPPEPEKAIEVPEEPSVLAPSPAPQPGGEAKGDEDVHVEENSWAELKKMVARYAVNHPAALRAVLERAPESAKPALRRAIAILIADYERAISALD